MWHMRGVLRTMGISSDAQAIIDFCEDTLAGLTGGRGEAENCRV